MLSLNPFYILFLFYLIVNFIFMIVGFNTNYVEIELDIFDLKSSSFIIAFIIQLFVCIFIFLFFLQKKK